MNRLFVALTACALATVSVTHANAYSYSSESEGWSIGGYSRGTMEFTCAMTKPDAKRFTYFLRMTRVPFSLETKLSIKTRLEKGQNIEGTLKFQGGKTLSFTGETRNGLAILNVPTAMGEEISETLKDEKSVNVTITHHGLPSETTEVNLTGAQTAVIGAQACIEELMDHAGVLP